jgi:hypothetical protein
VEVFGALMAIYIAPETVSRKNTFLEFSKQTLF